MDINSRKDANGNLKVDEQLFQDIASELNSHSVDFIVSETISGIWRIRRWNSGLCELEGVTNTFAIGVNTAWGSLYYADVNATNFPLTFISVPNVFASLKGNTAFLELGSTGATVTATPTYRILRPDTLTSGTFALSFYVRGRWK